MSTIGQGDFRSKIAAEDMTAAQYRFVLLNSSNKVELCDATNDYAYGILQNAPDTDEVASIKVEGESKLDCTSASGMTIGEFVAPAATGKGMVATTGQYPRGIVTKGTSDGTALAVVQLFNSGAALS